MASAAIAGVAGFLAGGLIGYGLSTNDYILINIPPDCNFSFLKPLARYTDEQPEYLKGIILPDPLVASAEELELTHEPWYTYWGLGLGNSIDRFSRKNNPDQTSFNIDMLGLYFPVTSKTVAGVVVNGKSDTYRSNIGKFAVRQYLFGASVIDYSGESFERDYSSGLMPAHQ